MFQIYVPISAEELPTYRLNFSIQNAYTNFEKIRVRNYTLGFLYYTVLSTPL